MILIFEMTWTGTVHAPGNSATIQVVARAWPEQIVRVHAEAAHLAELRRDHELVALPNVEFVPIAVSPLWSGRTDVVSMRRGWQEWRNVRAALARVLHDEPCLVFLISATPTAIFAAAWAARLSDRRVCLHVGFHGNLNEVVGWRSRNPFLRAFDTRSALEARLPIPCRFLVLEHAILGALAKTFPKVVARVDVLPLPINTAEVSTASERTLELPVRIGFVGLGTKAKGIDSFLAIAARVRARWGERVEFVHVGNVQGAPNLADYSVLKHAPTKEHLPRAEFNARLSELHYVFLPFRRGYYDFSASGALLDALTWLKPIITSRVPLTSQFFSDYGDIGHICDDEAGLEAAVEGILSDFDAARYARQVAALRHARESRRVDVLAARFRNLVAMGFPNLLDSPAFQSRGQDPLALLENT